jgi:hypothetical protein
VNRDELLIRFLYFFKKKNQRNVACTHHASDKNQFGWRMCLWECVCVVVVGVGDELFNRKASKKATRRRSTT